MLARSNPWLRIVPLALVLLGAAIVYLVGLNDTPLIDRDEPRYAQASKQMLATGNWVVPYYLDEPRLKKPPLIYWCQATSMKVLGATVYAARFPSALAFMATLLMSAIVLPRVIGTRRATWTVFMLATSLLSLWAAKTCLTDAVLLVWITIGQACLYRIWRGHAGWPTLVTMGLAIGLSLLTKGPVALMFHAMTLGVLWIVQWKRVTPNLPAPEFFAASTETLLPRAFLKSALVLAIACAVALPWVIALEQKMPGALAAMFGKEVVSRGSSAQEGHAGPPGFYLVTLVVAWFPWSILLPGALWHAWQRRRRPEVRFALAAILGPWLFLEIFKTKLPHYLLPAYPFMAFLTADFLVAAIRGHHGELTNKLFLLATKALAVILVLVALVMLIFPILVFPGQSWTWFAGALLLVVVYAFTGFGAATQFSRLKPARAAIAMGVGTWLICLVSWTLYFPNASFLNLSRSAADALRHEDATDVQMLDYKEASLAFYQGGTIREQSDADFMTINPKRSTWPHWLVTTRAYWDKQTDDIKSHWEIVQSDHGLNIADEIRICDVLVLKKKP